MRACNLCPNRPEAFITRDEVLVEVEAGEGIVVVNDDASINYAFVHKNGRSAGQGIMSPESVEAEKPELASGLTHCEGSRTKPRLHLSGNFFRRQADVSWEVVCPALYEALGGFTTAKNVEQYFGK